MPSDPDVKFTVEYMRDHRMAHQQRYTCPSCGVTEWDALYTETARIRDSEGKPSMAVHGFGVLPDPHLLMACQRCGFMFEMEVFRRADRSF